jgi:hypothetical protein
MSSLVSRIYFSREDRINELHDEKERTQWDGKDVERIEEVATVLDEHIENFFASLEEYNDILSEEVSEDSDSRMRYARQELVEKWALAQGALSKVAWVLRIDGNTAYERLINSIKSDNPLDMRGL